MKKQDIRKAYKEKRKQLSAAQLDGFSEAIKDQLLAGFDLQDKNVSVFLPIERFQEINTWKIIKSISANYVLPVIQGDELQHIVYESTNQILISPYGIPEPSYGDHFNVEELDMVLVPLLACDSSGNRVGYGKGFYDGFLKDCNHNCLFIGLSYFEPISEIEDSWDGDINLHHLVTPEGIHNF